MGGIKESLQALPQATLSSLRWHIDARFARNFSFRKFQPRPRFARILTLASLATLAFENFTGEPVRRVIFYFPSKLKKLNCILVWYGCLHAVA